MTGVGIDHTTQPAQCRECCISRRGGEDVKGEDCQACYVVSGSNDVGRDGERCYGCLGTREAPALVESEVAIEGSEVRLDAFEDLAGDVVVEEKVREVSKDVHCSGDCTTVDDCRYDADCYEEPIKTGGKTKL